MTFVKGTQVEVQADVSPGNNKQGGVARIIKDNGDGTFDVKFVLGGGRKSVKTSEMEVHGCAAGQRVRKRVLTAKARASSCQKRPRPVTKEAKTTQKAASEAKMTQKAASEANPTQKEVTATPTANHVKVVLPIRTLTPYSSSAISLRAAIAIGVANSNPIPAASPAAALNFTPVSTPVLRPASEKTSALLELWTKTFSGRESQHKQSLVSPPLANLAVRTGSENQLGKLPIQPLFDSYSSGLASLQKAADDLQKTNRAVKK